MIAAKLDNGMVRQLEETLLEAGFTSQEISVIGQSNAGSNARSHVEPLAMFTLTVHTKSYLDENLAKAVFHDCGVEVRRSETPSLLEALVPLKKKAGDIVPAK
jgi:hypothetical protein